MKKFMNTVMTYKAYHLGACLELSDGQLQKLIEMFNRQTDRKAQSVLGGRCSTTRCDIKGIGPVVIKQYMRGGFIRHIVKQTHLRTEKTRGQKEYEFLQKVRAFGINTPEPVAYAFIGRLVYKAWLITKAIDQAVSLAQLSVVDQSRLRRVMESVMEQVYALIENNILHVDLHPGNVIVTRENQVILIDFDKGRIFSGSKNKLRDRYLDRWQRAIIKHGLPAMLNEIFLLGCDRNFENS